PDVPGGDAKQANGMAAGPQFSLLGISAEDRKRRWLVLGFSPVFEAIAVGIMLWALMSLPPNPAMITAREEVLYFRTVSPPAPVKQPPRLLEQPVPTPPVATVPILPRLQQKAIQKPEIARLKVPEISQPKIELPTPPAPKPAETFVSAEVPRPVIKHPIAIIRTGAFNPGSMAKGTVKRPLREVQTGGFGANNGIPNNPAADSHTGIAQLGSFDLPSGPGQGNGTGGARGLRGTVASAGFGNGIGAASGGRPNGAAPQEVQQGAFGSVVAGSKAPPTHSTAQTAAFKPVVVLSKPDPVYPPEARRLHIEGQVILSVLFGASGKLRVLKVEQGLGHGMDAAAVNAAEQIKFKPAERGGRPVDSTAMVHIIFQLAY
ncbi:MAG TPA: TonB family protein, partial [Terriglobia bacterium]|nr:TonB family protein [Terriglobia bacterium]